MIIHGTELWKHSFFRFGRERWYKLAKKDRRSESTEKTDRFGTKTDTAADHAQKPEGCDEFAKNLSATGAGVMRELYEGFAKHQMCRTHADICTNPWATVYAKASPHKIPPLRGISEGYRRIKVRA